MPGLFFFTGALPASLRWLFGLVFFSFLLRGGIEYRMLYRTFTWKCIYGISHDLLISAALILGVLYYGTKWSVEDWLYGQWLWTLIAALFVEAYMAWRFSRVASPANKVYFASDEERFKPINRLTWLAVSAAYADLGRFLWASAQ